MELPFQPGDAYKLQSKHLHFSCQGLLSHHEAVKNAKFENHFIWFSLSATNPTPASVTLPEPTTAAPKGPDTGRTTIHQTSPTPRE